MSAHPSVLGAVLLALHLALPSRAERPAAGALELVVIDGQIPKSLIDRASAELRAKLGEAFELSSEAELARVRAGRELAPETLDTLALLSKGRAQYEGFEFAGAVQSLRASRAKLVDRLDRLRDYGALTDTLMYLGAAALAGGDRRAADEAFSDLTRLRPEYRVDPSQFAPTVVEAFERVQRARLKVPRGRLTVSSDPILAEVYVDEVAAGMTPVSLPLTVGEHAVRVELPGHSVWVRRIAVTSYDKLEMEATLSLHPGAEALRTLEGLLSQGGDPASMLNAGAALAAALDAPGVIVAALGLTDEAYLLSVVHLSRAGHGRAVAVALGDEPGATEAACAQLAQELAMRVSTPLPPQDAGKVSGGMREGQRPGRVLDYAKYGVGMAPGQAPARKMSWSQPPPGPPPSPLYAKWWVWAGSAAVAAAATGAVYYAASRPAAPPSTLFVLERQR
ncbi:MAG: PEGA domain-containing protein [Myxococcales bacterium]|nr:PEGA domain-containing protein [Myxococcales bacterium]